MVLRRGDLVLDAIDQLVVSRIVDRAARPGDDHELFAHEVMAKPFQLGRLGEIGRQPILDAIRHPLHRHPRPAQRERAKETHDADDQQRVTGEKCTFHENPSIQAQEIKNTSDYLSYRPASMPIVTTDAATQPDCKGRPAHSPKFCELPTRRRLGRKTKVLCKHPTGVAVDFMIGSMG